MNENLIEYVNNNIKVGLKILDLGAGDFADINELKKLGYKCEGVDLKIGVDLEKPYLSEQVPFDFIYSNFVLHFLKNKSTLLKSAFNNLKDDGLFFVQDVEKSELTSDMYLTEDEMKKMVESGGFDVTEIKKFEFFDNKPDHQHFHTTVEIHAKKNKK